ncbi:c-type cytochrome [Paraburkholderia lycopersici]|uniref:Cytochrome c n=1 Tax=Paraburkholderia lycopersici TaxID=416944 RepID=A0A1G6NNF5_9BURK|nr:c-type cytochrome [Paraburkholderia lycopersici]SDC69191.1 cytochrome c [Paraburkholderia lycopersici]
MKPKSQAKNKTATRAAALMLGALGALALGAAPARAQNGPTGLALAQQQNCMSCHSVTRTFMGPPLRDVAAKYAGKPEAQTYLARKILEGSTGVWGTVPMPANTQLNPGQAAVLANWVLTLK